MKVFAGSTTVVTTGNKLLVIPDSSFVPKAIHLQIGIDSNIAETSTGFSDGVTHRASSVYANSSIRRSRRSTDYAITHYRIVGSDFTKTLSGKVKSDGFDTPGIIGLEFDTCLETTSVDFIVYGE